jgi:hypothetical protein
MDAIRQVFPDATIVEHRVDAYPIQVIVTSQIGTQRLEVWKGRQQDLFRKNAVKRQHSIKQIVANLQDLKEDFDLE